MREKGRERETEMNIRESTKSVYSSIGKNSSVNVAKLAYSGVSNAASRRKNIYARRSKLFHGLAKTRRSSEG